MTAVSDWSTIATTALPAATALLGYGAAALTDAARDRRRVKAEAVARDEGRRDIRAARVRDFEQEQLVAAYEAIFTLLRMTVRRQTGPKPPLDDFIDARHVAERAIRLILDDNLRNDASQLIARLGPSRRIEPDGSATAKDQDKIGVESQLVLGRIADRIRGVVTQP
jgi:hypothetical protein